ncbi:hypothetical protein PHMEG_00011311 [Phytophthora megakarya]|uniref:Uncharacterized protein n=1 Tax=Phytophthora megakarya TaxID=4795 RepID=A0A225WBV1_9STRA|nr:hypothetical protein PHMEG_00011311 [Phytophthora megakarya]
MSAYLRTPASSPVSASTSVSTPAADPASAPTSASVPASAPVSAATPTPLSENFSVDKYFELQEKKLELEAKQCAGAAKTASSKTVFDGSSVLSTDGSIPVDYEEGELEDEGTSSSQSCDSKHAVGTREEDSDASSSKRPQGVSDAVPSTLEALPITSDPPVVPSEQRDAPRTDDPVREP